MMTAFTRRYLASLLLVLGLVLGGASAAGFVANAFIQLVSLVAIAWLLLGGMVPRPAGRALLPLRLLALAAGLMLAQLIPLPPAIWAVLPGHAEIARGFALAGIGPVWLPVSVTPDATLATLLALLPPIAMVLAVLAASSRGRANAVYVLIGMAFVSLALGQIQRLGGPDAASYFYEITNRGSAVGFFANRNHLATLLLIAMPFVAALGGVPEEEAHARLVRRGAAAGVIVALSMGIVAVGSAAGLAMLAPVLAACALLLFIDDAPFSRRTWWTIGAGFAGLITLAAIVAPFAAGRAADDDPQHRVALSTTTLRAAVAYLPLGAGGGSFRVVYPGFEDAEQASPEFVNHAHDDYAEVALEYGVPGVLLVVAALIAWLRAFPRKGDNMARAGFVAIGIVIVHSAVDYPLRTAAIAIVAALAAALVVAPAPPAEPQPRQPRRARSKGRLSVAIDEF